VQRRPCTSGAYEAALCSILAVAGMFTSATREVAFVSQSTALRRPRNQSGCPISVFPRPSYGFSLTHEQLLWRRLLFFLSNGEHNYSPPYIIHIIIYKICQFAKDTDLGYYMSIKKEYLWLKNTILRK